MSATVGANGGRAHQGPGTGGPYPMGLMGLLATITMLFAAFTAAILVRRTGGDWVRVAPPAIVYANTLVLALSSVSVELARRAAARGAAHALGRWLGWSLGLGALFVAGQIGAWRALAARGVYLPSNPHAAFFYTLTAVHAAHVLGGLGALLVTRRRAVRHRYDHGRHAGVTHAAIYWHFVGGAWVYLLALLVTL